MFAIFSSLLLILDMAHGAVDCATWIVTDCNSVPNHSVQVCGTDGRTHVNQCFMQKAACLRHTIIRKAHIGACVHPNTTTTAPSAIAAATTTLWITSPKWDDKAFLPAVTSYCDHVENMNCNNPPDHIEVCATNGITYRNKCWLDKSSCIYDGSAHKLHDGRCVRPITTQAPVTIKSTIRTSAFPPAVTSADYCNHVFDQDCHNPPDHIQVCGTNGITYNNKCELAKTFCIEGSPHKLHDGRCVQHSTTWAPMNTHSTIRAPGNIDIQSIALDIFCLDLFYVNCGNDGPQVCGSDGVFYNNLCEFDKQRCLHRNIHANGRNCS